jgi:hypothetical protein
VQIDVENSATLPPATRNFSGAMAKGFWSQRAANCSHVSPSLGQTDDNGGDAALIGLPKTACAEALARTTIPRGSTSNAGHAALSKPKTISELTKNQATCFVINFKAHH